MPKAFQRLIAALFLGWTLVLLVDSANAALMPHYRMDSFAWLSDAIIYCDEKEVRFQESRPQNLTGLKTWVQCKVLESFKGDIPKGSIQPIEFDSFFSRRQIFKGGYAQLGSQGSLVHRIPLEHLPAGKSLVFLKKEGGAFRPITAKLVQKNGVLQFCQCESNPGGFILAEQSPENITLKTGEKYGEKELLEDFSLALEKSRSLQQAVPLSPPH